MIENLNKFLTADDYKSLQADIERLRAFVEEVDDKITKVQNLEWRITNLENGMRQNQVKQFWKENGFG